MGLRNFVDLWRGVATADSATRGFLHVALNTHRARHEAECPCCGYSGKFKLEPHMGTETSCPQCHSLKRQRLFALAMERGFLDFSGSDVLHFAPDPIVVRLVGQQHPKSQMTADLTPGRAERVLNIEAIDLPDESVDRIVCSHVLEHVDDAKALAAMRRVLRPGGQIVIMIPIVEGWETSYENADVDGEQQRERHFGQWDHVRFFGSDFRARVAAQGLTLSEFTADGPDSARYDLLRGEKVFLASK